MLEPPKPLELGELVNRFQVELGQITDSDIRPLPDLASEVNHDAKFVKVGGTMLTGIYLDQGLGESHKTESSFVFQAQPGNRLTREDSHNKVFFGRLWTVPHGEGSESHVQVAVKSREMTNKAALIGEMALFQHLDDIGLKTFPPAGLLIGREAVHLMTYFDSSVYTMDTIEWPALGPDRAWAEVSKAIDTCYQLHTNMLFHGDLLFRNVAFDQTDNTVIIDPELMVSAKDDFEQLADAGMILNDDQRRSLQVLVRKMSHEFTEVCKSIDAQIIPLLPKTNRPRNDPARLKLYKTHLFEPYKNRIRDAEEPVRSVLLRVYDEMMMQKKANANAEHL